MVNMVQQKFLGIPKSHHPFSIMELSWKIHPFSMDDDGGFPWISHGFPGIHSATPHEKLEPRGLRASARLKQQEKMEIMIDHINI